jgi:hypothetical protein
VREREAEMPLHGVEAAVLVQRRPGAGEAESCIAEAVAQSRKAGLERDPPKWIML